MKRKLMALMLAGIMVIQSAGTSWAAEFTDGVNVEYGDSSENVNEEAFSDEQTEAENFEDDSPEKDLTEEAEVPAMASGSTSDENLEVSFNNGTLTISGSGMITQTSVKNCGHSLSEIKKVIIKKGITSIGACAFYVCSSLNSIEIPNSVTSIGD
ncbi:MAG: leucine-rich repeat protein, partial [Blautia wexlerae]